MSTTESKAARFWLPVTAGVIGAGVLLLAIVTILSLEALGVAL